VTSRISQAYRAVRAQTASDYLEPFCDVERVDHLRQQFRPKSTRLVILGESHVRKQQGPGFIYDAGYYTPWWRDLLRPAGIECLEQLQDSGIWILDASVIALSGYRNVNRLWPGRPFDQHSTAIFEASWSNFLAQEFAQVDTVPVVYFERAAHMLPEQARRNGTPLRFNGPRHPKALRYNDPAYRYGTARFIEAVRAAGL
jgi:hypothetical protein